MEVLKLRFIGRNGSMGVKSQYIYKVQCRIIKDYVILDINGLGISYTLSGFMANWKIKE